MTGEDSLASASDEALVRRVRGGERRAYDLLVGRYAKPMLNYLYRSLGSRDKAEEVWQQTFVTAFERLDTFDADRRFKPWIYGVATNLLRNAWRAMARLPRQLGEGDTQRPDRAPGPDAAASDREVGQVAWEGVRELSEEQRAVFVLRIYHGLEYAEIAEVLGCPEGTAKSRMHFAAESIRAHLRKRGVV